MNVKTKSMGKSCLRRNHETEMNPDMWKCGGFALVIPFLFSVTTWAAHECDYPKTSPSGSFQATNLTSSYKTGRNAIVSLHGTATDTDDHWVTPGNYFVSAPDGIAGYQWVITNVATSSPLNLTGQTVQFTTADGLISGSIVMKVKDVGYHYQDFQSYTQVASINVAIVDPNGVYIRNKDVDSPPWLLEDCWLLYTEITWQLTHNGEDLVWVSKVIEEYTDDYVQYYDVDDPEEQAPGSTWQEGDTFTCAQDGSFFDKHQVPILTLDLPSTGNFHVDVFDQRFKNWVTDQFIGSEFRVWYYMSHVPETTHTQVPK